MQNIQVCTRNRKRIKCTHACILVCKTNKNKKRKENEEDEGPDQGIAIAIQIKTSSSASSPVSCAGPPPYYGETRRNYFSSAAIGRSILRRGVCFLAAVVAAEVVFVRGGGVGSPLQTVVAVAPYLLAA